MSRPLVANIVYGIIVDNDYMSEFAEVILRKIKPKKLMKHIPEDYQDDYDPEYPLDSIEFPEEPLDEYISKKYPLLSLGASTENHDDNAIGYVVYVARTCDCLEETGDFEIDLPTMEEIAQLEAFKDKFAPNATIGYKIWAYAD